MKIEYMDKVLRNILIGIAVVLVLVFIVKAVSKECPKTCDDGNMCTWDFCNKQKNCEHKPLSGPQAGCTGEVSECMEMGCSDNECTEVPIGNCCGNNICEKATEDVGNCEKDCVKQLTGHFQGVKQTFWNVRGFRVIFGPVAPEDPQNTCAIKFKTSPGTVDIKLNDQVFEDIETGEGWSEHKLSCLEFSEEENDVSVTSEQDMKFFLETINMDDNGVDKYTRDGTSWIDDNKDMAIDIVEYR
ncbi:MAG: hypothetical protein QF824_02045 [Candidatus Woesearchaeota archaeon]|jgi:hypothetical protein|nr:hypothetical protein [Candidatus Woesearchaeota archaeon]